MALQSFTSCTQRCLLAVDHEETVAEDNSDCSIQVDDYTFHNEVTQLSLNAGPRFTSLARLLPV